MSAKLSRRMARVLRTAVHVTLEGGASARRILPCRVPMSYRQRELWGGSVRRLGLAEWNAAKIILDTGRTTSMAWLLTPKGERVLSELEAS